MDEPSLEDRLDAIEAQEAEARGAAWRPFKLALVLAAAALLGWWWFVVRRAPAESLLPMMLAKPASAGRDELAILCREMAELGADLEANARRGWDRLEKQLPKLEKRLDTLHATGRSLEPVLTREEQQVLIAVQWGEKLVKAELASARKGRGVNPERLATARVRFEQARDLLAGKASEHGTLEVARKLLAGTEKARQLGRITQELDSIKASREAYRSALEAAAREASAAAPRPPPRHR